MSTRRLPVIPIPLDPEWFPEACSSSGSFKSSAGVRTPQPEGMELKPVRGMDR